MTTRERCAMSDLPAEQCDHCRRGAQQLAPARETDGGTGEKPVATVLHRAAYDSSCPGCGRTIISGDTIGLADGRWLCTRCVERPRSAA